MLGNVLAEVKSKKPNLIKVLTLAIVLVLLTTSLSAAMLVTSNNGHFKDYSPETSEVTTEIVEISDVPPISEQEVESEEGNAGEPSVSECEPEPSTSEWPPADDLPSASEIPPMSEPASLIPPTQDPPKSLPNCRISASMTNILRQNRYAECTSVFRRTLGIPGIELVGHSSRTFCPVRSAQISEAASNFDITFYVCYKTSEIHDIEQLEYIYSVMNNTSVSIRIITPTSIEYIPLNRLNTGEIIGWTFYTYDARLNGVRFDGLTAEVIIRTSYGEFRFWYMPQGGCVCALRQ